MVAAATSRAYGWSGVDGKSVGAYVGIVANGRGTSGITYRMSALPPAPVETRRRALLVVQRSPEQCISYGDRIGNDAAEVG